MMRRGSLLVLSATASMLLGCRSAPSANTAAPTKAQTSSYPSRPNTSPPPVRLFHKTDTSVTLVTDPHATDEQIEALVWELRDAAHAHTFDKLGPGMVSTQAFVDKNKPTTWFHIYRGAKCAAEKYASGNPPCGGSYHAAADYTFGTPGNPSWDNGILLTPKPGSEDPTETPLWNPDAPYTAKAAS